MTWDRCQHGYWITPSHKCPWCFDPINIHLYQPVNGRGNGWLLKKDQPACKHCGGPAGAGWGLIPQGMSLAEFEAGIARDACCYSCTTRGRR